jgi:hypothetical protein
MKISNVDPVDCGKHEVIDEKPWWLEGVNSPFDLEVVKQMLPKSDEGQFIGNEYFCG